MATNRRDGGVMSCCGHSRKLRVYTQKELETVKAAQNMLGALAVGGGG
jgi:hypothetical protein